MGHVAALPWRITGLYARGGKRGFDLALVLGLAPLWAPLVLLCWGASRLEAGRGFYAEPRVGRHGRLFQCLKIRTMPPDLPRACAVHKPVHDPCLTPLGRFLRRSSLDELPQLFCVLRGEMSLVGPRPVPPFELPLYGMAQHHYLSLRPGLTGPWQVSGRNALPYARRVELDARYARSPTLQGDLRILLATLREIWRMSGR